MDSVFTIKEFMIALDLFGCYKKEVSCCMITNLIASIPNSFPSYNSVSATLSKQDVYLYLRKINPRHFEVKKIDTFSQFVAEFEKHISHQKEDVC